MSEEKQPSPQEAPKPATAETPASAPAAADAKAPAAPVKIEKPTNCIVCNKNVKKIRHYYRNGKFYCSKVCWKKSLKKEEKPAETQA